MGGLGPASNIVDGITTDIERVQKLSHHDLKPFFDYSQRKLCFDVTSIKKLNISLFTLSGIPVFSKSFDNISNNSILKIPMNGFSSGTYFSRYEYDGVQKPGIVHVR
jgi:hypothetical protein